MKRADVNNGDSHPSPLDRRLMDGRRLDAVPSWVLGWSSDYHRMNVIDAEAQQGWGGKPDEIHPIFLAESRRNPP